MIRAIINRGEWANQLRRLSEATRKSLEETIRAQSKLVVMDCVKATPPFTPGKNWKESFGAQRKAGQQAVLSDARKTYREAAGSKGLTEGRFAENVAKLIREGKDNIAADLLTKANIRSQGIQRQAQPGYMQERKNKRGRVTSGRPAMLHDGTLPQFVAGLGDSTAMPNDSRLRSFVLHGQARVGNAKAGWAKGAEALGAKLPKWITKQRGYTSGRVNIEGQGVKFSVEVNNGVPYIQDTGRELRIIDWALKNRARNIEKQIKMTLRKNKVTS